MNTVVADTSKSTFYEYGERSNWFHRTLRSDILFHIFSHCGIEIMSCQIVKFRVWIFKFNYGYLHESLLLQYLFLKVIYSNETPIINCLFRLFIRSSGPGDPPTPHQIGYLNVVPACTDPGGVFSMPKFADFGTTIANINAMFRQNPIQGNTRLRNTVHKS